MIYIYNLPISSIRETVKNILNSKASITSSNDLIGNFTDHDEFKATVKSIIFTNSNRSLSSSLKGKIKRLSEVETEIEIRIAPSKASYTILFATIIAGLFSLVRFFNEISFKYLFIGISTLLGGLIVSIWIARISVVVMLDRYNIKIHEKLK